MKLRLRILRIAFGYTQADIAKMLNCKQSTYCQYETCTRTIPIETLKALAKFYNTSIDFLVGFTNVKKPYPRRAKH